jgi:serine/threonine-protein kinase SRK2
VGTLLYMAPEVIKPQGRHYDAKRADIWSCGVLLYTMLVGIYPFMLPTPLDGTAGQNAAQQAAALHQLMVSKQYSIPANLRLSAGCQQLLGRLLEPDPAQRLTMQGLLQDAWFREGLPPAASRMTSQWLAQPPVCCQSEGQLKEVIGMAITYSMDELSMQLEESLVE